MATFKKQANKARSGSHAEAKTHGGDNLNHEPHGKLVFQVPEKLEDRDLFKVLHSPKLLSSPQNQICPTGEGLTKFWGAMIHVRPSNRAFPLLAFNMTLHSLPFLFWNEATDGWTDQDNLVWDHGCYPLVEWSRQPGMRTWMQYNGGWTKTTKDLQPTNPVTNTEYLQMLLTWSRPRSLIHRLSGNSQSFHISVPNVTDTNYALIKFNWPLSI